MIFLGSWVAGRWVLAGRSKSGGKTLIYGFVKAKNRGFKEKGEFGASMLEARVCAKFVQSSVGKNGGWETV